jgi:hypothetical protein
MADSSDQWLQYRRLRRLTFMPLAGCFLFVMLLLFNFSGKLHPILWNIAGGADLLCFLMFCYYGLRLSRFRCPGCSFYFSRGKKIHAKDNTAVRCRNCGLRLYSEV